ncbi:MAG TPA: hypothetical protein VHT74_03700 [Acetobacteraceae bacterium]|nr:hypothetical protein [Acetobacteraceae bacterium]
MTLTGREFQREAGDDRDKWAEAMVESAATNGYTVEFEWVREWLSDAMDAARKAKPPPIIDPPPHKEA